jgi:Zn finger protein HypA/HybF involved in hydrogenase expression
MRKEANKPTIEKPIIRKPKQPGKGQQRERIKMHQTEHIRKIIDEINRKAKDKKVSSVTIEVGELAPIKASELKELLEEVVKYEVNVKTVKSRVKCECGYEGEPKILLHRHDMTIIECPMCRKAPKILSGTEITVKDVKAS